MPYLGVYVYWDTGSIGTGVKQVIYHDHGATGDIKGELTYFLYYYFESQNIILSGNQEFLSFYLGFKSEPFNFKKEDISDYFDKAKNLSKVSENIVLGAYYNWNVAGRYSVGLETNFKNYIFTAYFNIF